MGSQEANKTSFDETRNTGRKEIEKEMFIWKFWTHQIDFLIFFLLFWCLSGKKKIILKMRNKRPEKECDFD